MVFQELHNLHPLHPTLSLTLQALLTALTHWTGPTHLFSGGMYFPLYLAKCYLLSKTQLRQSLLEKVPLCSSTLMTDGSLLVLLEATLCLPLAWVSVLEMHRWLCSSTLRCLLLSYEPPPPWHPSLHLLLSSWSPLSPNFCTVLPRWLSCKEPTCQCRRLISDSWVGKIPWRKAWRPTSVFLPGESLGQRSLAG